MGPLGARKVLSSSLYVLSCTLLCVCVFVCVFACVENNPRGPASYSLSAGDHHFHKTSIVGTELQTVETHTGNSLYAHMHTHKIKKIHTQQREDFAEFRSTNPSRGQVLFAMNKITVSPSKEFHLTVFHYQLSLSLSRTRRKTAHSIKCGSLS